MEDTHQPRALRVVILEPLEPLTNGSNPSTGEPGHCQMKATHQPTALRVVNLDALN